MNAKRRIKNRLSLIHRSAFIAPRSAFPALSLVAEARGFI
jgi:hypothetical protein